MGLGLTWHDLGDGYWRLQGVAFALLVLELQVIADAEGDDLLQLFGAHEDLTTNARRWLGQQIGSEEIAMAMHESEGYDEIIRKLVANLPAEQVLAAYAPEQRVAGLAPEQRIAGLAPEQRVAGLSPEQILLALPDEALRALPDAYLDTLSTPTREAIRARLAR